MLAKRLMPVVAAGAVLFAVRPSAKALRYPPQALRAQEQGRVHGYFGGAESGAIEHPEILGKAGEVRDAEVLRILQPLPAATASPKVLGRPARTYYAVPIPCKIK